jgi:hypothetical protein
MNNQCLNNKKERIMEVNEAYTKWVSTIKGEPNAKQAFTAGFSAAMAGDVPEEESTPVTQDEADALSEEDLPAGTGDEPNEFEVESEKQAEKEGKHKAAKTKTKKR